MASSYIGVDHCLKLIKSVQDVGVDAIAIVKSGHFGFTAIYRGLKGAGDLYHLLHEAARAWPELEDLDAQEAGKLASAAYEAIKSLAQEVIK